MSFILFNMSFMDILKYQIIYIFSYKRHIKLIAFTHLVLYVFYNFYKGHL